MWKMLSPGTAENGNGESLYSKVDEDGMIRVYHQSTENTNVIIATFNYSLLANHYIKLLVGCYNTQFLDSLDLENNKPAQMLIATTNLIDYYQQFMAGQGNYDEFEDVLYNRHSDGFDEDSLVFGNALLYTLYLRKHKLEKAVNENVSNL